MRSGFISALDDTLRFAGINGFGWSEISGSEVIAAYFCTFDISAINPSRNNNRVLAFSVQTILPSPYIYYVRSGVIHAHYGVLRNAGENGFYWSKVSHSDSQRAHFLNFDKAGIYPSYGSDHYNAFPVRSVGNDTTITVSSHKNNDTLA